MRDLKRLFQYLKPHWAACLAVLIMMFCGTGLDLLSPWVLRQVFDKGIGGGNYALVVRSVFILVAMYIARGCLIYGWGLNNERIGQRVVQRLRDEAYAHMQTLSFSFFDKHQTGQIMSRLTGDLECLKNFISWGFIELIMSAVTFVVTIAFLFYYDWHLTLYMIIPTPFLIGLVYLFGKKIRPAWESVREQMGRLTSVLQENVTGIRAVKAFAREPEQICLFDDRNKVNFRKGIERANIEATSFPVMDLLGGITFLVLVWAGGVRVIQGDMTFGTYMAFQWWAWGLIWPIRHTGWLMNTMQQALAAAPRVFEILDARPEVANRAGANDIGKIQGYVRFTDVYFTFSDGGELLKGVDLEAKPGQVIALIGGTGSGKSTFMNLIPRFYDITSGSVTIDGIDIREMTIESLRRQIGIVMQESFLFSATLKENIAYGRPDASMEEIIAAAKTADIHDFISGLEQGYETKVGERGIGLSGGQKQRVALARALVTDPRILLLDEATASVDTVTEHNIQKALKEAMKGRTTFVIAQRLSTVKNADLIAVLENGRLVEKGTHNELLNKCGYYRRIYDLQFSMQAEPAC